MADVLERLRALSSPLAKEAADEIERLRRVAQGSTRLRGVDALDAPAQTRKNDPETSRSAAAMFSRPNQRRRILEAYYQAWPNGLTAEEACERAGLGQRGWQRVSELRYTLADLGDQPMIRDTGERRECSTGCLQQVDVITFSGRRWLRAHPIDGAVA